MKQVFLVEINIPHDMYEIDEEELQTHLEENDHLGYEYKVTLLDEQEQKMIASTIYRG